MKILYEPGDYVIAQDDFLDGIVNDLNNIRDEEIRPVIRLLVEQYKTMNYKIYISERENKILKAQWKLREIEKEIDEEGGSITLLKIGNRFRINGFSNNLTNIINEILYSKP